MLNYDVYIFTEGGSKAGLGHITRCLALYDEMERRGLSSLFIINGEGAVGEVLGKRNYIIDHWIKNWPNYFSVENSFEKSCIIDSYLADETVYSGIQAKSGKALFLDDTNRIAYPDGIIVNPSIDGDKVPYKKTKNQLYLTGKQYVILRKEFQKGYNRMITGPVKNLVVILGGSDIRNITPAIIERLKNVRYSNLAKHIVIGKGFINFKEVEKKAKECPNTTLYYNLDAPELYNLLKRGDLAITAAGQTVYELIAMELPFICIKVISNQENNVYGLINYKIVNHYLDFSNRQNFEELTSFLNVNIERMIGMEARTRQIEMMRNLNVRRGVELIIDEFIK